MTAYPQGKILFESHMRMVFNEALEKRFTYSSLSRSVKKKWVTSGYGLKVMLGGSLFVSVHCTLQLSPFNEHTWRIGINNWRVTLFRMSLSPHQNLTDLMEHCNWSKRWLMSKVLLVSNTKSYKSTILPEKLMTITIFYQIILIIV